MNYNHFVAIIVFLFGFSIKAQECNFNDFSEKDNRVQRLIEETQPLYGRYEKFPIAVSKLSSAIELCAQHENESLGAWAWYNLAKIYYGIANYTDAEQSVKNSILLFQKDDDPPICAVYSHLLYANILLDKGAIDKANLYYTKEISELEYTTETFEAYKNIYKGKELYYINNNEASTTYLKNAEQVMKKLNDVYSLVTIYYYQAKNQLALKHYETAKQLVDSSMTIAKAQNYTLMKIVLLDFYNELHFAQKNYAISHAYAKQSNGQRDTVIQKNNQQIIDEIDKLNGYTATVNTINKLSETNSIQEKSLKFNQLAIILSVLLITILSLLTLSLYKNNNLRAKANDLLHKKNIELVKAKENAEEASKAKEQFLSTITHELRTPIYAITGLTYLLRKGNPTREQREHLKSLKYSGEHLLSLINNILDLNKLEARKVKKIVSDFNLKAHMKNFMGTLEKPAKDKNVTVHIDIDENIPAKLNGDILKVSQVLINLVGNSIKFSEGGDVWIRIIQKSITDKEVTVRFEVEDNGMGIPKDKQESIFKNFDQGSEGIGVKYGGTGLGLPIVKKLLHFLGSDIHLESEEGKGTKFYYDIVFDVVDPIDKGITKEKTKILRTYEQEQDKVFKGKRVLVVEDNKLNQKITQRILEKRFMECEIAENGKIAVEMVQKNIYDLILMDILMPEMDGIEATKHIRDFDKDTPIVALTAVSIEEKKEDFLGHGFNDIIPKPYKTEFFFDKIYNALNAK